MKLEYKIRWKWNEQMNVFIASGCDSKDVLFLLNSEPINYL